MNKKTKRLNRQLQSKNEEIKSKNIELKNRANEIAQKHDELEQQNIHRNTIRLSIGTEHIDDIIADLTKGFSAIQELQKCVKGLELILKKEGEHYVKDF